MVPRKITALSIENQQIVIMVHLQFSNLLDNRKTSFYVCYFAGYSLWGESSMFCMVFSSCRQTERLCNAGVWFWTLRTWTSTLVVIGDLFWTWLSIVFAGIGPSGMWWDRGWWLRGLGGGGGGGGAGFVFIEIGLSVWERCRERQRLKMHNWISRNFGFWIQ
jgi:hypothetical protein